MSIKITSQQLTTVNGETVGLDIGKPLSLIALFDQFSMNPISSSCPALSNGRYNFHH